MQSIRPVCLVCLLGWVCGPALSAPSKNRPAQPRHSQPKEYRFPGEIDSVSPHVPLKPETPTDIRKREALAWFMTGQIRERRNDFRGAYEAYRKAVGLDPKAIGIYRALVPLAFRLNRTREAIQFATKAVELDPDDYQLARTLAIFMASQRRFPEAIKLLETAVKSRRLSHRSATYVTIQRDLGLLYRALGDKQKAAAAYRTVFAARTHPEQFDLDMQTRRRLERDPVSSFERIGQVFLEANQPQLAIQAYRAAQQREGGKAGRLNFNLAKVYYQTKQYDKALGQLQKYLDAQLQTKGREAYQLLADILKAMGKEKELIPRLQRVAKKDPHNSTLQYFLAEQYLAANRLKEAEALYKKTMAGSDDPVALRGLAVIYRKQQKPQQWLQALQRSLRKVRNPEELEKSLEKVEEEVKQAAADKKFAARLVKDGRQQAAVQPPQLTFPAAVVLAKLAAESQNTADTVFFYRFALKQKPETASVIYSELGSYLLLAQEYAKAAKVFQEAIDNPALRQSRPNFLFRASQAYELAGQTDKALAAVREAQRMLPGVALLHYQEAWIYYHARKWNKAIPLFEKVIRDFATSRDIVKRCKFSLSNIYVLQGNRRKGEAILEEVYREDPDDISVNNDLGYLWAEQGKNLEQAEKMIRKAVKAEPDNPAYLDSMGWVLYKRGRFAEALPWLKRAVKLPGGGDATIWDHLGDCYERLNRHQEAVAAWSKALRKAENDRFRDDKLLQALRKKLGRKAGEANRPPVAAPLPRSVP